MKAQIDKRKQPKNAQKHSTKFEQHWHTFWDFLVAVFRFDSVVSKLHCASEQLLPLLCAHYGQLAAEHTQDGHILQTSTNLV